MKTAGKRDRHASRASLACTRCKRAKRRCDISQSPGSSQTCTPCRIKNEKCDLRVEDDKRRGKQRQNTKDLQSRIAALEDLIKRNVLVNNDTESWIVPDDQNNPSDDSGEYRLPASPGEELESRQFGSMRQDSVNSPFQPPPRPLARQGSMMSPMNNTVSPGPLKQNHTLPACSPGRDLTSYGTPDGAFGSQHPPSIISDGSSTVIDEVTARAGELKGRDGRKMKFFGATSMFYHGDRDGAPQSSNPSVHDVTSTLSIEAIDAHAEPEPIVMHLLELFFDWQAPHLNVVDRNTFMIHWKLDLEKQDHEDRTFYTPALLYAILSLASLISPDRGVRRYSSSKDGIPGDLFLRKARALLDSEIGNATATTVQAALLVGSWYGAVGQTSLGWIYSGQSISISGSY
jgi:hypothetical protein